MINKNEGICKFGKNVICAIAAKCIEPDFSRCEKKILSTKENPQYMRFTKHNECKFVGAEVFCYDSKTCKESSFPCYKYREKNSKIDVVTGSSSETISRPPLGAKPRYIWIEQRISELCEAISRFENLDKRLEWCKEVEDCLCMLKESVAK